MMYQNSLQSGLSAKEVDLFVFYGVLKIKTLVVHIFQMFCFPRVVFSVRFGEVTSVQRGQHRVDTWL